MTQYPPISFNHAIDHLHRGNPKAAEQIMRSYMRVMRGAMHSDMPAAHTTLATAFEHQGKLDQAEFGYRNVLVGWPRFFTAADRLGGLLMKSGRFNEAETLFRERLDRWPDEAESQRALAHVLIQQFRIDDALPILKRAAEVTRSPFAESEYLGQSLSVGYDVQGHFNWVHAHARMFAANHASFTKPEAKLEWDGKRPLRVGFVGNVFREHACAYVLGPVLEHTKHQVVIYADNVPRDAVSERMKQHAFGWVDTHQLGMEQYAMQLRANNLDVIIDLMGHKEGGRLLSLARHPAPIMLGYIGYAGETGITENIDREVGWAYRPSDSAPPVAALPYDRNGFITFGSAHRAGKITSQVLKTWAQIINAVPKSVLLVRAVGGEKNKSARQQIEAAGIPSDRLELVDHEKEQHCYRAFFGHIDIHLDTFPYNGGAVTFDAMWQGVPTITMMSDDKCAMGNKIAESVGLRFKTAAVSDENYVGLASHIAGCTEFLREFRNSARTRLPDPKAAAARFDQAISNRAALAAAGGKCCG